MEKPRIRPYILYESKRLKPKQKTKFNKYNDRQIIIVLFAYDFLSKERSCFWQSLYILNPRDREKAFRLKTIVGYYNFFQSVIKKSDQFFIPMDYVCILEPLHEG